MNSGHHIGHDMRRHAGKQSLSKKLIGKLID